MKEITPLNSSKDSNTKTNSTQNQSSPLVFFIPLLMRKLLPALLLLLLTITSGTAQNKIQSGWQFNIGTGFSPNRWDADFDSLGAIFLSDATLGINGLPAVRLYNKPVFTLGLNYLRNIRKPYTWEAGITASTQQIGRTSGISYLEKTPITITTAGIQAFAIRTFHPNTGSTLMIQIGAAVQGVFLKNTELENQTDTLLKVPGLIDLSRISSLEMELTSPVMLQGIGRLEWINNLTDLWGISASIEGRFLVTENTRFSGITTVNNPFFPLTTRVNTPASNINYLQFNVGVVRLLQQKSRTTITPLF